MAEEKPLDEEFWKEYEKGLEDFLNVPFRITIVIGRSRMTIGDLLQLEYGGIVEIPKSAGESFDVLINEKLVARGDVTIMEDRFGVRVTEFLDLGSRK